VSRNRARIVDGKGASLEQAWRKQTVAEGVSRARRWSSRAREGRRHAIVQIVSRFFSRATARAGGAETDGRELRSEQDL
jgi:hypothetical protein